jgi:hypothetical protein
MAIKVLANTVAFGTAANNVYNATAVRITNDGTARTIVIANTADPQENGQHGNYPGSQVSIRLNANEVVTVRKRPQDTITANSGVFGTKVAEIAT